MVVIQFIVASFVVFSATDAIRHAFNSHGPVLKINRCNM